jgi:death-on-curing protein
MIKISKGQILLLHHLVIKYTGGSEGLRDEGLLESALNTPFVTFAGISNYPTLASKAARLAYGLIKNHPFVDGNKRIGLLAMMSFLETNGISLISNNDDLVKICLGIADGTVKEKALVDFIIQHTE